MLLLWLWALNRIQQHRSTIYNLIGMQFDFHEIETIHRFLFFFFSLIRPNPLESFFFRTQNVNTEHFFFDVHTTEMEFHITKYIVSLVVGDGCFTHVISS